MRGCRAQRARAAARPPYSPPLSSAGWQGCGLVTHGSPPQNSPLRTNVLAVSQALLEAATTQGSHRGAEHLAAAEATGCQALVAAVRAAFPQLPSAGQPRAQKKGRTALSPPSAVLGGGASRARLGSGAVARPGGRSALAGRVVRPAAAVAARFSLAFKGRPVMRSRSLPQQAAARLVRGWLAV